MNKHGESSISSSSEESDSSIEENQFVDVEDQSDVLLAHMNHEHGESSISSSSEESDSSIEENQSVDVEDQSDALLALMNHEHGESSISSSSEDSDSSIEENQSVDVEDQSDALLAHMNHKHGESSISSSSEDSDSSIEEQPVDVESQSNVLLVRRNHGKKAPVLLEGNVPVGRRKKKVTGRLKQAISLSIAVICLWQLLSMVSILSLQKHDVFSNTGFDFDPILQTADKLSWDQVKGIIARRNKTKTKKKIREPMLLTPRMARAVGKKTGRSFGCLRETCRGLEIEEMLDRGWSMHFKTSLQNGTRDYKRLNYHVTVLMADTTNLNHLESVNPDIFSVITKDYEGSTYITAFEGGEAIGGNKGQQLRTKMRFASRFQCKYNDLGLQPPQYRLYIEEECRDLQEMEFKAPELTWLVKPEAGSQGQGILFMKHIYEIEAKNPSFFPCKDDKELPAPQRVLAQQYIQTPLLLQNCKFDVRVYILIASSTPWIVFYHEGYLRRALTPYSASSTDRKVYLTNTHFQSMKAGFKLSDHIWPFETFQTYLSANGITGAHYIDSILNPYIKAVAVYVFKSAEKKIKSRKGSFQIFGLDFMIDTDFRVHFIEANGYPGFTWSVNFDSRAMAANLYDLVQELNESPASMNLMRPGDKFGSWEMIHSDIYDSLYQRHYNPCDEFSDSIALSAPLKKANLLLAGISGTKGSTAAFDNHTRFVSRIPGWRFIGGEKGDTYSVRSKFVRTFSCTYDSLHIEPVTVVLYHAPTCSKFMEQSTVKGSWIVKDVQGTGNGAGLYYFESLDDLRNDAALYPCRTTRLWLAQKSIETPLLLHVTDLSQGEQIKVEIDYDEDMKTKRKQAADMEQASLKNPDNGIYAESRDKIQLEVQYDIRAYMLVAGVDPLLVMYHDGYLGSSRSTFFPEGHHGFTLDEHVISFESFQYYLATKQLAGPEYVSSILRPYLRRVMEYTFLSAKDNIIPLRNGSHFHQLFAFNFVIDRDFRVHLVGVSGDDSHARFFPRFQNISSEVSDILNTLHTLRKQIVLELDAAPVSFSRMRYGDSYGSLSVVWSEFEDVRQPTFNYDPCQLFSKKLPNAEKVRLPTKIQNFREKQKRSHAREMDKYVKKRWASCKLRGSKEVQSNCIRGEIAYRYMIYLQKERVPYDPNFIAQKILELQTTRGEEKLPDWKVNVNKNKD